MKNAIVTGASKGVGYETCKLLSENGYNVIAVSRNLSKIYNLNSKNIQPYELDITNESKVRQFYEKYKDISLDLLVHNAGGGASPTSLINETPENFRRAYDINVTAPMHISKLFLSCLQKSEAPLTVFITSMGGKIPYRGGGNYINAKRGMMALVDTMRLEYMQYGIRITEIRPGTINTQDQARSISLEPKDLAETIRWVASLPKYVNINEIEITHLLNSKFNLV